MLSTYFNICNISIRFFENVLQLRRELVNIYLLNFQQDHADKQKSIEKFMCNKMYF